MAAIAESSSSSADINWLSKDSCNSYIEQRKEQLKKDEEALELMRDELMRSQKETIIQGLCKLNKDVKKLSIKEFNTTFNCDVIDLIRKQMDAGDIDLQSNGAGKKRNRSIGASFAASGGGSSNNGLSLKTPAPHRMGKAPMTAMRTARKGEQVQTYSMNGSPIIQDPGDVTVTVKKIRVGGKGKGYGASNNSSATTTSFPISIGIGGGNGETIDLSDPNQRKNLDGEQKAAAMQQLMAIQEQMSNLMENF